jgi:uncharacterized protein
MDLESLARSWRQRAAARSEAADRRTTELRLRAREAAEVLTRELGAKEVWLFGSLAYGRIHERSDVDLAASGIPDERYFEALARVSAIVGEPVDLVPLESASPSLRRRILTRGIRLS